MTIYKQGIADIGDMKKSTYDPDSDGLIAVAQLEMTASKIAEGQGLGSGAQEIATPSAGATLTVAETEVFSGTSPTSYTDLDLSGTVGSQATLVLLKVNSDTLGGLSVRKNGDTDTFDPTYADARGCAMVKLAITDHIVLLVATDANGIIEWKTGIAYTITIDVIAYVK